MYMGVLIHTPHPRAGTEFACYTIEIMMEFEALLHAILGATTYALASKLLSWIRSPGVDFPEPTYCDGCQRFSRGDVCPYCD